MSRFSRSAEKTERARALRRTMTKAEWRLWGVLRSSQLGASFRRQHPIGPYYADFYCAPPKLVIEVDGGQHAEYETRDAARTAHLHGQGIDVIRFWNNDVIGNLDGVCSAINAAIAKRRFEMSEMDPLPTSPFQGEEYMHRGYQK